MAHTGVAYLVMAHMVVAYIVMAYIVMAHMVVAYIVMAFIDRTGRRGGAVAVLITAAAVLHVGAQGDFETCHR